MTVDLSPSNIAVMTRCGIGRYIIMFRSKSGELEEWKLMFDRDGMIMVTILQYIYLIFYINSQVLLQDYKNLMNNVFKQN
jgi:ABC-type tungstate transport system substrate-binding protein